MSYKAGKDFLLQIDSDGAGTYVTLGGLKTTQLKMNGEAIDVTNQGSSQWKEILDGAGIISMSLSGSGVFSNDTAVNRARTQFFARSLTNFKLLDGVNTFSGSFKIASMDRAGDYKGEQTWSLSLESSGAVTVA